MSGIFFYHRFKGLGRPYRATRSSVARICARRVRPNPLGHSTFITDTINNFLDRGILRRKTPTAHRAYQLGLITDPAGRLLFHWQNKFPFLWYSVRPGLRADDPFGGNVDVTDAFNETNNFELSTSRPLWNGASISLNWKIIRLR